MAGSEKREIASFESKIYSAKEIKIISAAQKLFLHYGLKKVSISDIAEASELSRPSLYSAFANKEAIVEGLMKLHIEFNHHQTKHRVSSDQSLQSQLEDICEIWIIEPFASAIDKENGKEVMATIQEYAGDSFNAMYVEFEKHLMAALKPHMKKKAALSAKDVAHIISSATKGLKVSAETLPDLRRLTRGLIAMTLALAE